MLALPPLYPITDARAPLSLSEQVARFGEAGFPLVQFRGKPLDVRTQWAELRKALAEAAARGGWPLVVVNDRADLALLAAREGLAPWGLHLGQGDLPPAEARRLPGLQDLHLGTSTHAPLEWSAVDPACDHAGVGPFRATATKGDAAAPVGLEGLAGGCRALRAAGIAPVAIGGLTLEDAPDAFRAGAESLAMVGELARAQDPAALLREAQRCRWRTHPLPQGAGVVLVGGSGAGKTALARALGQRLGLPALDLDQAVEARGGRSIPELFAAGEAVFRGLEAGCLPPLLARPAVVALGAGAWEDAAVRGAVQRSGFRVLWLAERPDVAWARVGGDPSRPLARDREGFLARWRLRMHRWGGLAAVLPLGQDAATLASQLTASASAP
jgi:thiamine-phosphate pyrophosphorylase